MITIDSRLTRAGYIKFQWFILFRKWYFYLVLIILILFIIANIGRVLNITLLISLLLFISLRILYMGFSSKNRNLFLPRQLVLNADSISITTPTAQQTAKWDAFVNWKRIGGYYVIYTTVATGLIVLKSAISPQDIPTFESLLSSNVKNK
jgi:hypothetical protein